MSSPPPGPHIKTTYRPDGTMIKEPTGYGGGLCDAATRPYEEAHGGTCAKTPTPEALQPSLLERHHAEQDRVRS